MQKLQAGMYQQEENGQKCSEDGEGPDFICDPVPYNYRKYYDRRRGKYCVAAAVSAAVLVFGWSFLSGTTILLAMFIYFLPLFGMVRWHAYLTKRTYGKKIDEYAEHWFAGTFTPDFLMTEDRAGGRKIYYYNDVTSVEETAESYHITGAMEPLVIPKMYLTRDAVRSVRHHLMRHCKERYEQNFVEEEEGFQVVISPDAGTVHRDGEKDYIRSVCGKYRFYYTEARIWVIGVCLLYLIRTAVMDDTPVSVIARTGLVLILVLLCGLRGMLVLTAKWNLKKSAKRRRAGIPTVLKVEKRGAFFSSGGKPQGKRSGWILWQEIKEICEGKTFLQIGPLYLDKKSVSEEQMGQIRALCQKYAGRKYHFIDVEPQGFWEIFKVFLPLLSFAVFVTATAVWQSGWEIGGQDSGRMEKFYEKQVEDNNAERSNGAAVKEQGSRQPVYVLTPDKSSLRLTASSVQISDCYSRNETNETSRFYIDSDGTLYGASANSYGELGLGNTESYLTAKGFYREMEIAGHIKHVSLGKEFVVYLTENGELLGAGNLPAAGNSSVPVELMGDVQYAKCSDYGIIILKEDGSVWCAGMIYDEGGNVIREYSGFEIVMEHAVFATAGARTMAVIQSDNSLWMWGDNGEQQCGVNVHVAETFADPVHVRDGVQMVWADRLSFSSAREYQGYLAEEKDPYVSDRTYIKEEDGEVYACGDGLSGESAFVKVMVTER